MIVLQTRSVVGDLVGLYSRGSAIRTADVGNRMRLRQSVTLSAKSFPRGGNVWLARSVPPGSQITQGQVRQDRCERGAGI